MSLFEFDRVGEVEREEVGVVVVGFLGYGIVLGVFVKVFFVYC